MQQKSQNIITDAEGLRVINNQPKVKLVRLQLKKSPPKRKWIRKARGRLEVNESIDGQSVSKLIRMQIPNATLKRTGKPKARKRIIAPESSTNESSPKKRGSDVDESIHNNQSTELQTKRDHMTIDELQQPRLKKRRQSVNNILKFRAPKAFEINF